MNNYAKQLGYTDDLHLLLTWYDGKLLKVLIHDILHVIDDTDGLLEEMFNDYVEDLVHRNVNLKENVTIVHFDDRDGMEE